MPRCPRCDCNIDRLVRVQHKVSVSSISKESSRPFIFLTAQDNCEDSVVEETYHCPICNATLFDDRRSAFDWLLFEDLCDKKVNIRLAIAINSSNQVVGVITRGDGGYRLNDNTISYTDITKIEVL